MTGAPTSTGAPGDEADDLPDGTDGNGQLRPRVVQISTYSPAPGADLGIRSQAAGGPVVFARRVHPWRALLLVVVLATALGIGGVWVYNTVRRAQHQTTAAVPTITSVGGAPTTTAAATGTTAPPPTLPAAGSLFSDAASGFIAPAVESAAAGDPSKFTSIAVYPAYALATVDDPTNPARTIRVTIRGGDVIADEPLTNPLDISPSLFTIADVNWAAIGPLVVAAPAAANVPADVVDHVVVQRWGFDPTFPMRILVYLSGGLIVEGGMDGAVIAVH
jgi:hypothetical protein